MPETKFSSERILIAFVDQMITEKYGEELSRERREELRAELYEQARERIQQAAIEALPDAKLVELEKILDRDGTEEELAVFFESVKDVDTTSMTERALKRFRDEYLGKGQEVEQAMAEAAAETPARTATTIEVTETQEGVAGTQEGVVGTQETRPPEGSPVQGLTSDIQGQADIEGRNNG